MRVAALIGMLGLGALLLTIGVRIAYSGKILPGTRVMGVGLGGVSKEEAGERLGDLSSDRRAVTLVHGDRRLEVRANQVGFQLDVAATVSRALRAGRLGPLKGWGSTIWRLVVPRTVAPVYTLRRAALAHMVAVAARRVGRPAFRGGLVIDPGTLTVDVLPPRSGLVVERRATAEAIFSGLRRPGGVTVRLPTRNPRGVARQQVEEVAEAARSYLRRPLRLTGAGRPLVVSAGRMARVLAVEPGTGDHLAEIRLGVAPQRMSALVGWIARRRDRAAVMPRLTAPPPPLTFDSRGDVGWRPRPAEIRVRSGRAGLRTVPSAAAEVIAAAVREGRHRARLPTELVPPGVTEDQAAGCGI